MLWNVFVWRSQGAPQRLPNSEHSCCGPDVVTTAEGKEMGLELLCCPQAAAELEEAPARAPKASQVQGDALRTEITAVAALIFNISGLNPSLSPSLTPEVLSVPCEGHP